MSENKTVRLNKSDSAKVMQVIQVQTVTVRVRKKIPIGVSLSIGR